MIWRLLAEASEFGFYAPSGANEDVDNRKLDGPGNTPSGPSPSPVAPPAPTVSEDDDWNG